MKIIFMGSARFAVPSLNKLAASKHDLCEVVTQPDKPAGRGMHLSGCPVAEAARRLGRGLFQPKDIKSPDVLGHFRLLKPDIIVVVAYGKILPTDLLTLPQHGCVNLHASLLPKYRGAAPINWAVANGETETGVTTQKISEELDAGDILFSEKTPIGETEDARGLYDRLSAMGADLLMKTMDAIEFGRVVARPQDPSQASYAPILKKEDGRINWQMSACEILGRVRGFVPWPGTYTTLGNKMLRVHGAKVSDEESGGPVGCVVKSSTNLAVACGRGVLYLTEVQLEGKRRMSAADFLRGHKIPTGTVLI